MNSTNPFSAMNFVFDKDAGQIPLSEQHTSLWQERAAVLARLSAAINAGENLSTILRLVRDGLIGVGGFDRAGVFLYDPVRALLTGTWGTDRTGHPVDISSLQFPIRPNDNVPAIRVIRGELDYYLSEDHAGNLQLPPDDPMAGVRSHAVVPLKINGSVVGILCVDNLIRNAPITHGDVEMLMPYAHQAALAVQHTRLQEEVRATQSALMHSEKMRAIGELASGVAHNVNNVLAIVLACAEMIQETEGATAEICHLARMTEIATLDGRDIVKRVQLFARREETVSKLPFDVTETVQQAIDLTRPVWLNQALGHGIKIKIFSDLTPNLYVLGVASEMREVLVNLIKNACEAMPDGGTLTVRCHEEESRVLLEVADTGIGMEEGIRQRIFEPFYTTKTVEHGTGLGLSVTWGIIERHAGQIEAQSAPGEGTTFTIRLPRVEAYDAQTESMPLQNALSGVRILLVEAEEPVITCLCRILTAHGAILEYVQKAEEALAWLNMHGAQCDMVLTDHGMVGMTGLQFLAQVRQQYPDLRRVLLSGWASDIPGDNDLTAAELILPKPLPQRQLVSALAQLLRPYAVE